ncbi:MAG: Uma2 family endonuclease [Chloroflexaceae bacterium]|nr:Uma2 family endonuclease [Chloroflexaceae bacterium]
MNELLSILTPIETETWMKASWQDFIHLNQQPDYEKGRFYYDRGWMKIEMSPIGIAHARDNQIILTVISLYGAIKQISLEGLVNVSLRKTGIKEVQPDLSYYIGDRRPQLPWHNSPINLDETPPPNLIIEIGSSSFFDDIGRKRLLYEQLEIEEYWVINVAESQVIAFSIQNQGSYQIRESQVLSGLAMALVEEALSRSKTEDDSTITRWLMTTF